MRQTGSGFRSWSAPFVIGAWWLWVSISTGGMVLGARIASWEFPIAPYLIGRFGWVFDFVLLLCIPLAVLQCVLLFVFFKPTKWSAARMLLWIPVTYGGVVAMFLTIWSIPNALFAWTLFILFFPSSLTMGYLQWSLVLKKYNIERKWILWSALSPLLCTILFFSMLFGLLPEGASAIHRAMLFAGCFGFAFGVWQATVLVRHFSPAHSVEGGRSVLRRRSLDRPK